MCSTANPIGARQGSRKVKGERQRMNEVSLPLTSGMS